ncbi:MAG TPA: glutathione S-transferase family protein [Acetobacteraceae bacterium]|nr:glutathione S-transferase family protein [Acetobacteraceae bacterium]
MAEFLVHFVPGSPFSRSVLATLEEKAAAYRVVPVAPGALRAEAHLALHPFGRVPVLEHDGFVLYETQAILRYLDRALPVPRLTPPDPRAAARMDQVMNVSDWYLFQGVGNVIGFHRIVAPTMLGLDPDEAAIASAMPRAHTVFAALADLLGEQAFFAGDRLSLADLLVGPQLDFIAATPEWPVLTAERPFLVAWLERMKARPSFQATTWDRMAAMAQAA